MFLFNILKLVLAYYLAEIRFIEEKEVKLNGNIMIKAEESN